MSQSRYLIVNQTEWERLKKQASPPEETSPQQQHSEYLQGLIEKSQEWIKAWPDSLQGVVNKLEERIEKKRQRELDMIKAIQKIDSKRVRHKIKSREEAKEKIFDDTGYGRQLLSALIESKTLEERDAQVQFQKEIKQKAIEQQAMDPNRANCSLKLDRDDDEEMRRRKQKNKKIAAINKNMHKMNKQKTSEENAKEKLFELEDARLMKQLLKAEAHRNDKCEKMERKAAREFEVEQKIFFENKANRDLVDDSLIKLWRDYHDKVQCKSKKIFEKLHKGREDTENMKKTYEQLQILQDIEKKTYEEFIMKGVQKLEDELTKKDKLHNEQDKKKHENLVQIAENNKRIAAENQEIKLCSNKCACDGQSLFSKPCTIHKKKKKQIGEDLPVKPLSFLAQPNELHEKLKKRAKEPTPWNALKASHEFFSRKAGETLAECKFKNVARKVVDEYRKTNCVDSTTLPVLNY